MIERHYPDSTPQPKTSVAVVGYQPHGFPWIDTVTKYHLDVYQVIDERTGPRAELWRNTDRMIRQFWLQNRSVVTGDVIWWLEWDVYLKRSLPEFYGTGMGGKDIKVQGQPWQWFKESDRLPVNMRPIGIAPLGVSVFTRAALDEICRSEWDELYAADVFGELRTPSIIHNAGLVLSEVYLPRVRYHQVTLGNEDEVYHAVKP